MLHWSWSHRIGMLDKKRSYFSIFIKFHLFRELVDSIVFASTVSVSCSIVCAIRIRLGFSIHCKYVEKTKLMFELICICFRWHLLQSHIWRLYSISNNNFTIQTENKLIGTSRLIRKTAAHDHLEQTQIFYNPNSERRSI